LKLDTQKYEKFTSRFALRQTTYSNDEEGITYTVAEDGEEVLRINYYPSESDCAEADINAGRETKEERP